MIRLIMCEVYKGIEMDGCNGSGFSDFFSLFFLFADFGGFSAGFGGLSAFNVG